MVSKRSGAAALRQKRMKRFFSGIFCFVLFLLLWVSQSVRSTQLSYEIQKLEEQIKEEQNMQVELKLKRDRYFSLEYVETLAKKKYGLILPPQENIVILPLPEG